MAQQIGLNGLPPAVELIDEAAFLELINETKVDEIFRFRLWSNPIGFYC